MTEINAMVAHEDAEGGIVLRHEVVDESFLPDGDVDFHDATVATELLLDRG